MIPSSEEKFSWSIIKHKMSVKLPNNYSDKCRQTAADTAGCMANCSCNWTYFTRASENLARLTAALFHSLHLLFLLLHSSASLRQLRLTLSHTHSCNCRCFSLSAENLDSLGPDQTVITASSESHPDRKSVV